MELSPTTYVLVSGFGHGGWCWRRVAGRLRSAGHDVFAPTQTGLGERAHLLHPDIGLDTFINDIVYLIDCEELDDIILVGHSFGGMAITGTADRLRRRIRHIVYLDAIVPLDGQCAMDHLSAQEADQRLQRARDYDGGISFPPPSAQSFAVTAPADVAWLTRRLTPHPVKTYTDPIALQHPPADGITRTYIRCTAPVHPSMAVTADWLYRQRDWDMRDLTAGHSAQITTPEAVADILLAIAVGYRC